MQTADGIKRMDKMLGRGVLWKKKRLWQNSFTNQKKAQVNITSSAEVEESQATQHSSIR